MKSAECIIAHWDVCPVAQMLQETGLSPADGSQAITDAASANYLYPSCSDDGPASGARTELRPLCGLYGTPEVVAGVNTVAEVARRTGRRKSAAVRIWRLLTDVVY